MKKKKLKDKDPNAPFHLPRFGGLEALYFDDGGYARVSMDAPEVNRFIEALQTFALRKGRIPDPKVLSALDLVADYFDEHGSGIKIVADVPIAVHGVRLEPIMEG